MPGVEVVPELTAVQLDVYDSREGGVWHPEHGVLQEPEGWEFLPLELSSGTSTPATKNGS